MDMDNTAQPDGQERLVHVSVGPVALKGALGVPAGAHGIVLLAHGSGSSWHSPRNRYVAQVLREGGLATRSATCATNTWFKTCASKRANPASPWKSPLQRLARYGNLTLVHLRTLRPEQRLSHRSVYRRGRWPPVWLPRSAG
jgi:hypothetical protein